jgi:hypothetical protein
MAYGMAHDTTMVGNYDNTITLEHTLHLNKHSTSTRLYKKQSRQRSLQLQTACAAS